ncbi:MAG: UDP-N-acetylmuramoyl-L-alanine--D-glutamate ligase [Bacteroidetes bacterium]|nr:UDP-N-acetylmuramoyl-L-alanine--D-glutamate ligase [Bacteroidota bacterium]
MSSIAVLGAGESGVGAALLAKAKGIGVWVSDKGTIKERYAKELEENQIPFEQGQHSEDKILSADVLVKSPGIPNHAPLVKKALELGKKVISEIEFASYFTNAKLIGITGTNGKTTTTNLTHHLLIGGGLDAALVGNIGVSMARELAKQDHDYFVVEMSSFQLDFVHELRFHVAMLLNITPDHLDRYNGLADYAKAKFNITKNQTSEDYFIYGADDEILAQYLDQHQGNAHMLPFSQERQLNEGASTTQDHISIKIKAETLMVNMEDILLKGSHNRFNTMASIMAAKALSVRKDSIRESLGTYKNIEHRLEFVARVRGVDYVNDSKATNVNATWYALESMETPVIWIVGGIDKGNDYSQLYPLVREKVRGIVCLGVNNEKIRKEFNGMVDVLVETESMKDAVQNAYRLAKKDETVLLAPACASFDLFNDYIDRGNQYKRAVLNL